MNLGPVRKAIVAAIVAGTGALATAAADNTITVAEWAWIAAATTAAAGAVYGVRNKAA